MRPSISLPDALEGQGAIARRSGLVSPFPRGSIPATGASVSIDNAAELTRLCSARRTARAWHVPCSVRTSGYLLKMVDFPCVHYTVTGKPHPAIFRAKCGYLGRLAARERDRAADRASVPLRPTRKLLDSAARLHPPALGMTTAPTRLISESESSSVAALSATRERGSRAFRKVRSVLSHRSSTGVLPTTPSRRFDRAQPVATGENRFFQEDFDDLRQAGYLRMAVPRARGGWASRSRPTSRAGDQAVSQATLQPLRSARNMHNYWVGVARSGCGEDDTIACEVDPQRRRRQARYSLPDTPGAATKRRS